MGAAAIPISAEARPAARLRSLVLILVGLGVALVLAERIWLAAAQPLWLDETWTAAIVSPPDSAGFWREVYLDSNAPLYYGVMRLWTGLFGIGDLSLRLPGVLFVALAGVMAATAPLNGLSREARWTWGGLIFFWWGVGTFLDARCYSLLLLLCVGQAIAYGRLIQAPSQGRAALWVALSALAILTQYYAALICVAQGVIYLALHRSRAARTWPALLILTPVAAWIVHHLPRLMDYARPDVAWHARVNLWSGLYFAAFPIGANTLALTAAVIVILLAAAVLPARLGWSAADREASDAHPLWAIAAAGLFALALTLLSGVLKPTLTARYLIPLVPSILMGVSLCARATAGARAAYAALALAYLGFAADPWAAARQITGDTPYGNEQASAFLAAQGVSDVVFIWDHPVVPIIDPGSLKRVGGVIFAREGHPVRVIPLRVRLGDDPSRLALAAAAGPSPGVVWVYDRTSPIAGRDAPPHIEKLDPRWACRRYGDAVIGTVACYRRGL